MTKRTKNNTANKKTTARLSPVLQRQGAGAKTLTPVLHHITAGPKIQTTDVIIYARGKCKSARVPESGSHDYLGTEKTSAGDAKPVKIKQ